MAPAYVRCRQCGVVKDYRDTQLEIHVLQCMAALHWRVAEMSQNGVVVFPTLYQVEFVLRGLSESIVMVVGRTPDIYRLSLWTEGRGLLDRWQYESFARVYEAARDTIVFLS